MLSASLHKRLGRFALELELVAESGTTLVLAGESGSGKSTVLRLLAGLLRPDAGRLALHGEVWVDTAQGEWRAAWERPVGYVPQDYALFPHLTALENVAFGLEAEKWERVAVRRRARELLGRFGIADLADRRPAALSGGQQQRVALARALALAPRLLLLDEPLAALDLQTRRSVRGELRGWLRDAGCVTVLVTHSPLEALALGDRIAVLDHGQVVQTGSAGDFLRHPRSAYVAEFMGLNLLQGTPGRMAAGGAGRIQTAEGAFQLGRAPDAATVFLAISPREITLSVEPPAGSAQNVFRGPILELVPEPPLGERVRVLLGTTPSLVAEVTPQAVAALGLAEGRVVYASFKATGVITYT